MTKPDKSLPGNVRDAMRGGNKVEAIKRLRQSAGIGLKEAKDLIEAHARQDPRVVSAVDALAKGLPAPVVDAIQRGSVLEAIRLLRAHVEPGLKQAGEAVDRARPAMEQRPAEPPDTFNRVVSMLWWILALILGGFAAYYFVGGSS